MANVTFCVDATTSCGENIVLAGSVDGARELVTGRRARASAVVYRVWSVGCTDIQITTSGSGSMSTADVCRYLERSPQNENCPLSLVVYTIHVLISR
jgi:hypothetical protein